MGQESQARRKPPQQAEAEARRARLAAMHLQEGLSFAEIARRESERTGRSVSRERIRRLIRTAGVSPTQSKRVKRVPLICEHCGETFVATPARARRGQRFKDAAHYREHRKRQSAEATPKPHLGEDGHWWVSYRGRSMRLERYVAERMLGRELETNEWVTLKDGDPNNVSEENVLVAPPGQVRAHRALAELEKSA